MSAYYLTPKAAAGIESIWEYIAEDSSVSRADKVVDDIFQAIENLADMPGMGHSREDLTISTWMPSQPAAGSESSEGSDRKDALRSLRILRALRVRS